MKNHTANIYLYPYHFLPPIPKGNNVRGRDREVLASLLYFDTVTLGTPGLPQELGLPTSDEALADLDRIRSERGPGAIYAFLLHGDFSGLSVGDVATLSFLRYWYDRDKFLKSYTPLIDAGVIRTISLAAINDEARSQAEFVGSDQLDNINMFGALSGYVVHADALKRRLKEESQKAVLQTTITDTDGLGFHAWYLRSILASENPDYLTTSASARLGEFYHEAVLLDVHHQALISTIVGTPLVSFEQDHIRMRSAYISRVEDLNQDQNKPSDVESLAVQVMAETLSQLPAVIPKSVEALLELRSKLAEELVEFREAIKHAAIDIHQGDKEPDERQIKNFVDHTFQRPVTKLSRRLSHPNRDLMRNLITTESVVSGAVAFAMICGSNPGQSAALSALGGVAAGSIVAALKTRTDRSKEIETSGVAFLLKASKSK